MKNILNTVVGIAIGLTVLFLLLNSIIMPNYNTTATATITGTGMTAATYQGILLLVFVLAIIGVAMSFFSTVKVGRG